MARERGFNFPEQDKDLRAIFSSCVNSIAGQLERAGSMEIRQSGTTDNSLEVFLAILFLQRHRLNENDIVAAMGTLKQYQSSDDGQRINMLLKRIKDNAPTAEIDQIIMVHHELIIQDSVTGE